MLWCKQRLKLSCYLLVHCFCSLVLCVDISRLMSGYQVYHTQVLASTRRYQVHGICGIRSRRGEEECILAGQVTGEPPVIISSHLISSPRFFSSTPLYSLCCRCGWWGKELRIAVAPFHHNVEAWAQEEGRGMRWGIRFTKYPIVTGFPLYQYYVTCIKL